MLFDKTQVHPEYSSARRMDDATEDHSMRTYARLNTLEVPAPRDFSDFWQEPSSWFLASGMPKV